jgi:5,10-methylenetetrahydromethanopterin reductase
MRVVIRVSPFAPVSEVVEFTRRCEDAGFDGVGYLDSQMINRDVFVTLGQAAVQTKHVSLISAVTNPVTRHVSTLASAAATVDDLAPGRVEVWLGRGFSSVNLVGLPAATTRELGNAAQSLRRLLAGEWDVFPGAHSRMRTAPRVIPVYLAGAGPRTIRLAGKVADGLILNSGYVPALWERGRELVAEGAAKARRNPTDVKICLQLLTCIRSTREEALRYVGPLLALQLNEPEWLRDAGIHVGAIKIPEGLSGLYPDPMHAENHEMAMDLSEKIPLDLRWEIASRLGLIGTPEDCITRLQEVSKAGFGSVFMRTVDTVSFPAPEVEAFRNTIRPAIDSLR